MQKKCSCTVLFLVNTDARQTGQPLPTQKEQSQTFYFIYKTLLQKDTEA